MNPLIKPYTVQRMTAYTVRKLMNKIDDQTSSTPTNTTTTPTISCTCNNTFGQSNFTSRTNNNPFTNFDNELENRTRTRCDTYSKSFNINDDGVNNTIFTNSNGQIGRNTFLSLNNQSFEDELLENSNIPSYFVEESDGYESERLTVRNKLSSRTKAKMQYNETNKTLSIRENDVTSTSTTNKNSRNHYRLNNDCKNYMQQFDLARSIPNSFDQTSSSSIKKSTTSNQFNETPISPCSTSSISSGKIKKKTRVRHQPLKNTAEYEDWRRRNNLSVKKSREKAKIEIMQATNELDFLSHTIDELENDISFLTIQRNDLVAQVRRGNTNQEINSPITEQTIIQNENNNNYYVDNNVNPIADNYHYEEDEYTSNNFQINNFITSENEHQDKNQFINDELSSNKIAGEEMNYYKDMYDNHPIDNGKTEQDDLNLSDMSLVDPFLSGDTNFDPTNQFMEPNMEYENNILPLYNDGLFTPNNFIEDNNFVTGSLFGTSDEKTLNSIVSQPE
ncbi:hypothetical protein SNEBB_007568 [Seison nebaliae]|nr:hypothetical protein SNEBB_007568 [Seison nebaliae]